MPSFGSESADYPGAQEVWFGKYRGERLDRVPQSYIAWAIHPLRAEAHQRFYIKPASGANGFHIHVLDHPLLIITLHTMVVRISPAVAESIELTRLD